MSRAVLEEKNYEAVVLKGKKENSKFFDFWDYDKKTGILLEDPAFIKGGKMFCYKISCKICNFLALYVFNIKKSERERREDCGWAIFQKYMTSIIKEFSVFSFPSLGISIRRKN